MQPPYTGVAGPVGLAVNASGLSVQLECVMGIEAGGDGSPTPDSNLLAFPVQTP